MLNKKELLLVNEVVKGFDNTCYVVANEKEIIIIETAEGIENSIFSDKIEFIEELINCVKNDLKSNIPDLERKTAVKYLIELNNIKYNHLKNIVLEATKSVTLENLNKSITLLDNFINLWCYSDLSLKKSQSIKTYRDIIINCETVKELQETLKDIYYMKKAENVKNNDYIIETIEAVKADKEFFKNECDKHHELYDEEAAEYLNSFRLLNKKFMYIA